jgi:hypothetical protein
VSELQVFYDRVKNLTAAEELFGPLVGGIPEQRDALKHLYRQFVKITHEDRHRDADKPLAFEASVKLQTLFKLGLQRVETGTYGTAPAVLATVKTKTKTYQVTSVFAGGDLTNVYHANDGTREVLLKVSRHRDLNDLVENEAKLLKKINDAAAGTKSYRFYMPELIESARVAERVNDPRALNVLVWEPGWVPLTEVLSFHPDGVDPRHGVWIWKRLLTVMSFAHGLGLVHGAVLPTHVLVNPVNHGVRLVDWSYGVETGSKLRAMSTQWKALYAPEVERRLPVTFTTDIYMAAKTLEWVLGDLDGLPRPYERFIKSCLLQQPTRRPSNAWALYEAFTKVAEDVYGKPRFVPLTLA